MTVATSHQLARVDHESTGLMPAMTAQQGVERYNQLVQFVQQIMKRDKDFGVIPGTDKPTLLKPGAEKLCSFFGLAPDFQDVGHVEKWDIGFFHYVYKCVLSRNGEVIGSGIGSANSKEKRYRWRSIPVWKATPEEKAKAHRTEQRGKKGGKQFTFYIVENDDPYSLVNTLQKMAQKRALVAAVLVAANASEFFTQDVEDLQTIDVEVIDRETGEVQDQDRPDLSDTEDFLLLWDNVCEGKGLDIPTGRGLLEGLFGKKGVTAATAPIELRQELLTMLRAQNPDSIQKIKQRAAQSARVAPADAQRPAADSQDDSPPPASSTAAEPSVLDPVVDPWLEETRALALAKNPDTERFHQAMVKFIQDAKKTRVTELTAKEKKEIRSCIEEQRGHFAYLAK